MRGLLFLEEEPPAPCEMCGRVEEVRAYGQRKPDGKRMRVCWDCALTDTAETARAFNEWFEGKD
jgi:ribosome-binding protein aMBF1 (putative translation factor)